MPGSLAELSSSWLHLMGRLRDGQTHEQADVGLQRIWPAVLEATTNPDAPADRRASSGAGRRRSNRDRAAFPASGTSSGDPCEFCPRSSCCSSASPAPARRTCSSRGVARQREIAIPARRGCEPREARATTVHRLACLSGHRCWPRRAARHLGRKRPRRPWRRGRSRSSSTSPWAGAMTLFALALAVCTAVLCSVLPPSARRAWRPDQRSRKPGLSGSLDAGRSARCSSFLK